MKRAISAADSEIGREKTYRRQEPVSCTFCRSKKLKCSREAPCSNCSARKLNCSLIASSPHPTGPVFTRTDLSHQPSNPNLEDLQSRLRRLEELLAAKVLSDEDPSPSVAQNLVVPSSVPPQQVGHSQEDAKSLPWIETDALENEPFFPDNNNAFDIKVAENFSEFVFNLTRPQNSSSLKQDVAAALPSRKQAEPMLEFYFLYLNWIYHIIHVPTVRGQFNKLYTQLENHEIPDHGPVSLISTILALSAYFSTPSSGFYFHHSEAISLSRRWTAVAQDALSASHCLTTPSIETLQSLILISQLLVPNIGAIASLRSIAATTIYAARQLDLHLVDSPSNRKSRENTLVDWAEIEVKRRLWWHITSTDWFLSFMSGPQCGTYMVQPKHMSTELPSNVDDSAINSYGNYAQPEDEPTEMTYTIYRIKGSIIFREIADASWDHSCDIDSLPYDRVLEFDAKLNNLIVKHDKVYSKLGKISSSALNTLAKERDRKPCLLIVSRIISQFGIHTRSARLHRPYLIKGAQDPRYAYSRMVCLRSSRKVIECGRDIINLNRHVACIKLWMLNHHIFVSTVILVMDYCFNREEPRARERKEEILECFKMLEVLHGESTIASRGLLKLRKLLREGGKESQSGGDSSPSRPQEDEKAISKPQVHYQPPTLGYIVQQNSDPMDCRHNDLPPPYQFNEMDFSSFDDFNFDDVDLAAGQFEALFNSERELF